jgi:hypothetical protein
VEHNNSIHCNVRECRNHCESEEYCTLKEINVIKNSTKAKTVECTDCGSFQTK